MPKGKGGKPEGYRHSPTVAQALAQMADRVAGGASAREAAEAIASSHGISASRLRHLFGEHREDLLRAAAVRSQPAERQALPKPTATEAQSHGTTSTRDLIELRLKMLQAEESARQVDSALDYVDSEILRLEELRLQHSDYTLDALIDKELSSLKEQRAVLHATKALRKNLL